MEFELGQTYSGYRFLERLGNFRNAVEYRVCNVLAERQELLKVVAAFARDDRDSTDAILREARILARLSHPNIIGFYTAQPIEGRMALTTEWPDAATLASVLQAGPFPVADALDAARQLLSAISCAHRQSVLHLNITPENILQGVREKWKLANFSLARLVNGVPVTGDCAVTGNPRYISPEQVKGTTLDLRSDLYSFGIVLYEILCGRPPFDSKSQFELMLAHVNQSPEAPSRVNPSVPEALDEVLIRALAKHPKDRYESADAFESAIAQATVRMAEAPSPMIEVGLDLPESAAAIEETGAATGQTAMPDSEVLAEPVGSPEEPSAKEVPVEEPSQVDAVSGLSQGTDGEEPNANARPEPLVFHAPFEDAPPIDTVLVSGQATGDEESNAAAHPEQMADSGRIEEVPAKEIPVEPQVDAALGSGHVTGGEERNDEAACELLAVDEAETSETVAASAVATGEQDLIAAVESEPLTDGIAAATLQVETTIFPAACEAGADATVAPDLASEVLSAEAATLDPALAPAEDEIERLHAESAQDRAAVFEEAPAALSAIPMMGEPQWDRLNLTLAFDEADPACDADPEVLERAHHSERQEDLWAAAEIVAQAAAEQPPVQREPVTVVTIAAAPAPEPTIETEPIAALDHQIPTALPANNPNEADAFHWIMFGSSAAFLGIVLIAIFFSLR